MTGVPERMSRQERNDLAKVAKLKAKDAKSRVAHLKADRVGDFEELLATQFEPLDKRWADVVKEASRAIDEAVEKVNARIDEQLPEVPKRFRPSVRGGMGFNSRGENYLNERRVELRRVAATRYDEMAKYALAQIDEWQTRTEMLSRGLSSAEAQEFLESMPEPGELLPQLRPEDVSTEMRRELTQKARTGRGYLDRPGMRELYDDIELGIERSDDDEEAGA